MANWGPGVNQLDTSQTGDGKKTGFNKVKDSIADIYSKLNRLRTVDFSEQEPTDYMENVRYYDPSEGDKIFQGGQWSTPANVVMAESTGYGVIAGLSVSAQNTPDMSVYVEGGTIHMPSGKRFVIAAIAALAILAADPLLARIDRVYINSSGQVAYTQGTAAASPVAPELPSGSLKGYQVNVAAGATSITNSNLTDERAIKPQYHNLGTISPKDFGAVGDGIIDDTAVMQNAINYASTNKKSLLINGTFLVSINTLTIPQTGLSLTGNGVEVSKIITNDTTDGGVLLFGSGCSFINVSNIGFKSPNSKQAAFQLLGSKNINFDSNKAENCSLVETGSNTQTSRSLTGYYTASNYSSTTDSNMSKYITITNNTLIGDSSSTVLAGSIYRPGILLAYSTDATVKGNKIYGYIHGCMYWGGDAGITKNGAIANERKAKRIVFDGNIIDDITAGGDIWGSMGDKITAFNNFCGYAGDVGIDFEGSTSCLAKGNTIYNRTNGGMAIGFLGKDIVFTGNIVYTDTHGCYLLNIFGTNSQFDNSNISVTDNDIIGIGNVIGVASGSSSPCFDGLTFSNNRLKNMRIDFNFPHRNLVLENNQFLYDWNISSAIGAISFSGFTGTGGPSLEVVKGNRIISTAAQSLNNSSIYCILNSAYDTNATIVDITDNDLSGLANGWTIVANDTVESAVNLKINILRNKISTTTNPVLTLNTYAIAYREGNYYNNNYHTPYPNGAPSSSKWFKGEFTPNPNQAAGGYFGNVCVVTGTPGTWKGYGTTQS